MTREYKVSFYFFTFIFFLLFFLPHAAHGRLAVHHNHRSPPHNQYFHRQADLASALSGVGSILSGNGNSPDSGGSSPPPSSNTAPGGSPVTTAPPATDAPPATTAPPATNAPPATTAPSSSDPLNAGSLVNGVLPGSVSSSPPQTSDPPPTSDSTTPSATSNPQSNQSPSSPSTASPPSATCPLGVDLLGHCILSPASDDVQSTSAPSSPSQTPTSSTPSGTPLLPLLSSSIPISLPPLSSDAPTSSAPPSSDAPASSAPPVSDNPPLSSIPISLPILSSNAPTSSTPNIPVSLPLLSSDPPAPTSSTPNLPISLPLLSSDPPAPTSSNPNIPVSLPLLSSDPPAPTSSNPNLPISLPLLSSNAPAPASSAPPSDTPLLPPASLTNLPSASAFSDSQPSPSPAQSSNAPIDPCGPLGLALGLCPTPSAPIPSSGSNVQQSFTSFSAPQLPDSQSQLPPVSTPGTSNLGALSSNGPSLPLPSIPISSQGGVSSIPDSFSQPVSNTAAEPSATPSGANSASFNASSPPVISFPSYTTGPNDQATSVQPTPTRPSDPVQNSEYSYVTVTSLLGTYQGSSIPATLTNPDAAATTLTLPDPSTSAAGPSSVPLPTDLPARIYAADLVDSSTLPNDVLCSLLFTSFLSWDFVAKNPVSQGQIFAWVPIILSQALNITSADTPPFALQVFVPADYTGPTDVAKLLTEYLFYLPENLVSVLAAQIKVLSSPLYNISEPYRDLAHQFDASFSLTSVPNPYVVPGAKSPPPRGNNSRTATIIGVVSALGGLALVILGVLVFNSAKRSRQLRHQRLSDPNLPNDPYPDRSGRDFDQDSVGGPRRRSFYFAEDSLRGQPQTAEQPPPLPMAQAQTQYVVQPESQIQYSSRSSPENTRERRAPVAPGTISAPILTQSSLNW